MGFDLPGCVWVFSSLVSGVSIVAGSYMQPAFSTQEGGNEIKILTCVFTSAVQDRTVQRCKRTGWTQQNRDRESGNAAICADWVDTTCI